MDVDVLEQRPGQAEAIRLYDSVGWSAYTGDPAELAEAIAGSHRVFIARSKDGLLIGLARTISDGRTIVYLQDILVDPEHHRKGVGGQLLDTVLKEYSTFRQLVLLTDAEASQRAFYESRGLTEAHEVMPHPVRTFVQLR